MPRIFLKPNSPEFHDKDAKTKQNVRQCDMPGCPAHGEHRAPRDRGLQDYYWFCLNHVKEYNSAWNFFQGMSGQEVEDHIINSLYGDRPTRRYDNEGIAAENLRRAAWQTYNFTEEEPVKNRFTQEERNTPEFEALALMGLEPPITLAEIKTRYKELAKKYHPDLNGRDTKSEEILKRINMAYTILKLAYDSFDAR
ncbi:MAG: J domain-containing protein [Alphaproteobacteria bacterium]